MGAKVMKLMTRRHKLKAVVRDFNESFTPCVVAFPRSVHVLAVRHLAEDCHRLGNEPERAAALLKSHADAYEVTMIGRGVEPGEAAVRASEFQKQVETMTAQAKELAELVQKIATETSEPIKTGASKLFKPAA